MPIIPIQPDHVAEPPAGERRAERTVAARRTLGKRGPG